MSRSKQSVRVVTREPRETDSSVYNAANLALCDGIELSVVVKGRGTYRILDATGELGEGDLFVFDSGLPHGFFAESEEVYPTLRTLYFSAEILGGAYADREEEDYCYGVFRDHRPASYAMLNAKAAEKIKSLLSSLQEEGEERNFGWEQAIRSYLSVLMLTLSRYLRLADTVENHRENPHPKGWTTVSFAIREIMEHFGEGDVTLDAIASKLFVSKSHLSRLFTRVTGANFTDYVRDVRLSRACSLLSSTRLSNEEIVKKCGLKDVPSFYRLFKTYTGMTPYRYRMTNHAKKGETTMSIYNEISENLQQGKAKIVKELVMKAVEEGLPAGQILNEGLVSGMNILGEKFKNNEVYVPEVLVAARAMNMGMQVLKPLLIEDGVQSGGKVCIGTVQGDLHDIGKNLVKMMMEGKGLEVVDLGTDVSPETFVQTAVDEGCKVICCSALLTTTMDVMGEIVKAAEAAGVRDKVKIMVGGAPVTEEFCKKIGADCYTSDAASAADAAVELCKA